MKRLIAINIFILLLFTFSGCSSINTTGKDLQEIEFEMIYNGFTFFDGSAANTPPLSTYVFTSEEDWDKFNSAYLPGVNNVMTMNRSIDFDKYSLIYTGMIGAKSTYSTSVTIEDYKIENNELKPIFGENENIVYAHNDGDQFVHFFVILSLVKKDDYSEGLQNIYK